MSLRSGHGTGKGTPRVETKPWDEQKRPAGEAAPLVTGRDAAGRVRSSAAARELAKLPRRFAFVPRKLACDPRFEPHNRRRLEYLQRRRAEVCSAWGHVSHGVGAMLSAEAWLWAAGEMASELGAEMADAKQFALAANLYAQARQVAAAAWELAERESVVKRKRDDAGAIPIGFESVEGDDEP